MSDTLRTTASVLNVRDGAGTAFPVRIQLPAGSRVFRLDATPTGQWLQIRTEAGDTGWIYARYAVADAPPAPTLLRVTATTLNLRGGPGTAHEVRAQLPDGALLEELESGPDGWVRVRTEAGTEGWVSRKWVELHEGSDPEAPGAGDPDWYEVAWGERGVRETAGAAHSARIVEYHKTTTLDARTDEVAWCSSFVNWVMKQTGNSRTRSAAARSWLDWGRKLPHPVRGCVVVFKRGEPWQGHVGFYVSDDGEVVRVLGGNQENQVKVHRYKKAAVLGYRWPSEVPLPG
jgi:uncharacterized protein (TIGR02594 family)